MALMPVLNGSMTGAILNSVNGGFVRFWPDMTYCTAHVCF